MYCADELHHKARQIAAEYDVPDAGIASLICAGTSYAPGYTKYSLHFFENPEHKHTFRCSATDVPRLLVLFRRHLEQRYQPNPITTEPAF
ncbi:hypothetical protein [Hymenobacter latericus]|uniref:hypothetical protein n=1 Tax=Hymenobacter sp. YIM 151858-1 TaxID=2987688 RepID=UPI0022272204|nr:hypothetical protein [Hymenobacter sp. YIM 151858-1]UYZ60167.1 hypothetical protein OIS50_05030 [Hymenobacter sp. YIM 151858-1]